MQSRNHLKLNLLDENFVLQCVNRAKSNRTKNISEWSTEQAKKSAVCLEDRTSWLIKYLEYQDNWHS